MMEVMGGINHDLSSRSSNFLTPANFPLSFAAVGIAISFQFLSHVVHFNSRERSDQQLVLCFSFHKGTIQHVYLSSYFCSLMLNQIDILP